MGEESQGMWGGAAQGAALGTAVMPGWGTAIGAGVGALGGAIGGKGARKARRAASAAAFAMQKQARNFYNYQSGLAASIDKAMNDPREMALLGETMSAAERDLARQESMINAMDPAVKEAATQAYELLRGKEAASMGPLRAERQRQRQTLLNTLRAQLGPGAENSSAGQQALNRFDSETSNIMANQQQSSLTSIFNIADRGTQYNMSNAIGTSGIASGFRSGRAIQGAQARSTIMAPAWEARMQTAGGQYTGQMMQGQYQNQMGGQLLGALTGLATAGVQKHGFGFMNNKTAPTPQTTPQATPDTGGFHP